MDISTEFLKLLEQLLPALVQFVLAGLGVLGALLLTEGHKWLKVKAGAATTGVLLSVAKEAVLYAEQFLPGKTGPEKRAAAIKFALDYLAKQTGLKKLDPKLVGAFIEAALLQLKYYGELEQKSPNTTTG